MFDLNLTDENKADLRALVRAIKAQDLQGHFMDAWPKSEPLYIWESKAGGFVNVQYVSYDTVWRLYEPT